VALLLALGAAGSAHADSTTIRIGKTIGGSGFHTPSYVAMDQGFFKAEGLDASFVTLQGRALVTAGIVPAPH
jgi:ABC-type nitrate/sulfonate/bicarbonate transport system substrate-binding protein